MIVIMVSDCPPKIRGDLSKWLCEINTGVFVGNVSSRVRDEIWDRVCNNIKMDRQPWYLVLKESRKWIFGYIIRVGNQ